jgi:preprotein translocase subunit SecY
MSWKIIWSSLKNSEMRNRLLAVLGILFVFRIMAHIPIPLSDTETLQQVLKNIFSGADQSQFLSFVNVLSGGALANFSIMLIGLGPYINASIIFQLLTKAIPKLENLQKEEGEMGRRKINQYTRMLTLPLAIIQSVGAIYLVRQTAQAIGGIGDITAGATLFDWALMVGALTGGAMILMWLGELITEKSVGNGISLLITVGIVSQLPGIIVSSVGSIYDTAAQFNLFGLTLPINGNALAGGAILLGATVVVTVLVVMLNEAKRNLTVNYAKRVQGNRAYGGVTTSLPIKLITAGVIPIIFAVAFLSVPSFAGQLLASSETPRWAELGTNLSIWFQTPSAQSFATGGYQPYIYPAVYFLLVFMFTFFYTGITFDAKQISENLQKQGGFISGVRSGAQTEKYLGQIVTRLTLFGAISLGLLAVLPILGQIFLRTDITIGGTSILILVAVALETLRSVESRALMVTYDQYEQPDYFADEEPISTGKEAKKRRILPRLGNRKDNKK